MNGRPVLAASLVWCLAACSAPRTPELEYLPPTGQPAAIPSAVVQQAPALVWGNILDHLQQQGLELTGLDEQAGELVVTYHGDPEPYVDCGWIVAYGRDALERVPAAVSEASFPRRRDGRAVDLGRDLRLDARMNVQVEPEGETDALVRIDSLYLLTKTVIAPDVEQPLHVETIRFVSGESAAFSAGTRCQPNGNLERVVLDALPAVSLAGS
jgi:hypothetical protein